MKKNNKSISEKATERIERERIEKEQINREKFENKLGEIVDGTEDKSDKEEMIMDMLGLGEISKQLIQVEKIKFLSNISPDIENKFSILYALNTKLKSELLDTYLLNSLMLKTAISGKRAEDLIEITKGIGLSLAMAFSGQSTMMGEEKKGFLSKLREKV